MGTHAYLGGEQPETTRGGSMKRRHRDSKDVTVDCDYCGRPAERAWGSTIYPNRPDLAGHRFWHCRPCGAYVGCHPHTNRPLGRLANAELRQAKVQAHKAFDPLWREHGMTRTAAYAWLALEMGLDRGSCHIGMFDVEQCQAVVDICTAKIANIC